MRQVRHARVRAVVKGTIDSPRLSVFRSLRGMTAQLIDDGSGKTVCSAATKEITAKKIEGKSTKVAMSYLLGELIAKKAQEKKITKVVFDRGGYKYHGRVSALADGARAGGLKF